MLALLLLLQADFTELYRQAYEERRRAGHPKANDSAVDLALYLAGRGQYAQAAPFAELVLAAREADATILHNWAAAIEDTQPELAERLYRKALAIREKTLPAADLELATSRLNLAGLLVARGEHREAEALARSALAAFERAQAPVDGRASLALGTIGAALAIKGDIAGAERYLRRALAIARKAYGLRSEEAAAALENLADLLAQTGRAAAARPLKQEAQSIRRSLQP